MSDHFSSLKDLVFMNLAGGSANAVERLFRTDGFRLWNAARQEAAIVECEEPLVEIPPELFLRFEPHAYVEIGAPYQGASPFFARRGVVQRLLRAQALLRSERKGFSLKIFDAYRPLAVQKYLVEHFVAKFSSERGWEAGSVTEGQRNDLLQAVYEIIARPNDDPKSPTPHSTGGAVDLTIVDDAGIELDMGSAIDAPPPHCLPSHFQAVEGDSAEQIREHRLLLQTLMGRVGFQRLPQEWWHFSYGDQAWAVLQSLESGEREYACYGRADLLS